MGRLFILIISTWLIGGCTPQMDPAPEQSNQEEGMFEGEQAEAHNSDALLTDSRDEVDGTADRISTTDAEALVREHLNISATSNTIVLYDSELEDGRYVIHVYDVMDNELDENNQVTQGWYTVDPITKDLAELNRPTGR
ncbi:hypothetical protein ACFSCX_03405 [Bacillus salitolerans]|uniref:Uncharacterized protein n=1 Tax=Bacillus salitolerans TaxID=1437434 RepID=A0ABW4LK61_9BACI